jgi:hypothetical protein
MGSDFETVFERLRGILRKHAKELTVSEDSATRYCLEGQVGPATLRAWGGKVKVPMIPVAWVQIGKAYVSFHLMGVYGNPGLQKSMSLKLRKRMQGKTCFNFSVYEDQVFEELEEVTLRACDGLKLAGFIR